MANKLLSAIEDGVFLSAGSVPVVIEGIEHTYDTEILFLRRVPIIRTSFCICVTAR